MDKNRLVALDGLRGIAAISVVIYHYFYRYNDIYDLPYTEISWLRIGEYGVHLFFIISGFVIYWTLLRTSNSKDFIYSRFSRLYPTFWSCLIITFIILTIFPLDGRTQSLGTALLNFLMFHQYLGVKHVDGVYWTLTIELTFYFWMFLAFRMKFLSKIPDIFVACILLSAFISVSDITLPKTIRYLLLLDYLPFFLAGICFFKIYQKENSIKEHIYLTISLLTTSLIHSKHEFIIFTLIFMAFYVCITFDTKIFTSKLLVFLGSISYPLYLIHQNIGYVLIHYTSHIFSNHITPRLIAIVLSIIIAFLIMKFIEIPSVNYLRKIKKR